ncbi:MAG: hypothetical protein WB586_28945 [Chthoniobacterales bacterium]
MKTYTKGRRFGALGDLLCLDAQAGVSGAGVVSRVGLGMQEFLGEFFASYRVIQRPCGWLDLLAGFRSTYIGQQTGLNANEPAIDVASTRLVDDFAQQLTTPNSDLRMLIQQNIVDQLSSPEGRHPPLPVGPIFGDQPPKIANLVQALIQSQQPELAAAIRAGVQAKVAQLKAQLASQVANILTSQLNRSLSFYDDWFDPLIGVRGRLNLSKAFYLTAETDVGGFGIGSDIAWQGYAALGCQITRNIYSEIGVPGSFMMTFETRAPTASSISCGCMASRSPPGANFSRWSFPPNGFAPAVAKTVERMRAAIGIGITSIPRDFENVTKECDLQLDRSGMPYLPKTLLAMVVFVSCIGGQN